MNDIPLTAWDTMVQTRDITFLGLFFFAAVGLFMWRLFIAGHRLVERLAAAVAVVGHFLLIAMGLVELWKL